MVYQFEATIQASVTFTTEEFLFIWKCCSYHYSDDCKRLIRAGGILYGLKGQRDFEKADVSRVFSFRELDTITKAMEMENDAIKWQLTLKIKTVLEGINATYLKVNADLEKERNKKPVI